MKRALLLGIPAVSLGLALGCKSESDSQPPQTTMSRGERTSVAADEEHKQAIAHIHGAGENRDKIHGTATFTQEEHGVKIVVDVEGLTPGKHGIHIHEKPDLSDPKLMSAGPHFNPDDADHRHGGPNDPKRHAGDLGNIEAESNGHGHLDLIDDDLSVGGKNSVVGHSLIIHEKRDDLKSQPAGDSGARIGGGVIVLGSAPEKPNN